MPGQPGFGNAEACHGHPCSGHPEMEPLIKQRLKRPHTIFFPGHRIKMNIVPMFLNIFVPWMVFIICCGLTGFWAMYKMPKLVFACVLWIAVAWMALLGMAAAQRRRNPEPTWFSYIALVFGIALIAGVGSGRTIFETLSLPGFEIESLKVVHSLDVGRERGQDLMDVGIAYFANGSHLDQMKSWHFKHRTLYCVAPVIQQNGSAPATNSFDFWVVGKDCCATTSSDYRCGNWNNAAARSGIRILDAHDMMFYRLAVQQAETLYGIVATHPIFFTWEEDPLAVVKSWSVQALKNYIFLVALAFAVSLTLLAVATARFAWIGRSGSRYDMDFYDDPEWKKAGWARPPEGATRSYAAA